METQQDLTILDSIANEFDNVEQIRNKLFTVYDLTIPKPKIDNVMPEDVEDSEAQIIYNSKGKYLGVVGGIYQSIQPEMFLNGLLDTVQGCGDNDGFNLDLSKLEYRELKGGNIIEFRLPTDTISFKNSVGKSDETQLFINFFTGFGGTARTEMGLYSKRLICSNGMRIIESETELKVKHTERMNQKAMIYCKELLKTVAKVQETSKVWEQMDSKQVNSETVKMFAEKIAGVKKDETKGNMSTRKANILNQVNEAIAAEFKDTGATVWGLLNGATRFTNHYASGCKNEDYILVNSGAKLNTLAQREAMLLLA